MSLAEISLDLETRSRIRRRYREQMRRWCPALVQSRAPLAVKGLMIMMTELWGRKDGKPRSELHFPRRRLPRRRRPRWRKGGYGVYDLRILRRFGEWIKRVESHYQGLRHRGPTAVKTRLTDKILNLIPWNDWVPTSRIADTLGISSNRVGLIISHRLLHSRVERKPPSVYERRSLYRRIS